MRLSRLLEIQNALGLEHSVVTRPVSVGYLTGLHIEPHERLLALVTYGTEATILVPGLEIEKARSIVRDAEVIGCADGEDAYARLGDIVGQTRKLGVEKAHLTLYGADRLREVTGAQEFVDIGGDILRLRARKSREELEKLSEAARLTDEVVSSAIGALKPGLTELEAAALVEGCLTANGTSAAFGTAIASGPNSALPHLAPTTRRIQRGDLVLVDLGAVSDGYRGDITRMAVVGEPDERQREVHRVVLEAHDRAIEAVREGVTAGEVDAAARRVIAEAGFGEYFIHRVGHGLGLEAHEDPSLAPGSGHRLEAGMVATVEPGVYIPGWGGVRIEDDVVVEKDGATVLTHAPTQLRVIPA